MGNLCQLSSVKRRLGIDTADTTDDTILTNAIKAVSARFNKHCNRLFDRTSGDTHEFDAAQKFVLPRCYPIESVSAWHLKSNETDGWEAQSGVDYLIRRSALLELSTPLGDGAQLGRVTYTGGYVLPGTTPGSGQTALPDDVEQAAIEQAAYWYQRRNQLGLTSVSGEGASLQNFGELDLLPAVRAALVPHIRHLH